MITFSQIGLHGRLGNQLHQYALLKAVSERTGHKIYLPHGLNFRNWHGQQCMLENFKLTSANYEDIEIRHRYIEHGYRIYDEGVFNVPSNTDFFGHFEHKNYANDIRDILLDEFQIKNEIENKIQSILAQYSKPTVSLHIRRGDLLDAPDSDSAWSRSFGLDSIYGKYYGTALSLVPQDCVIFVFSGGARLGGDALKARNLSDLNWCKKHFVDSRAIFVEDLNDIETFCLMKSCTYNITSYGSTFSWWASFLNKNQNIIAPKVFFPTDFYKNLSTDQFYPSTWQLI